MSSRFRIWKDIRECDTAGIYDIKALMEELKI